MGIQRVAAIDALFPDEVEVPRLVSLHGDAPASPGRRHVERRVAVVSLGVVRGAPESVGTFVGRDHLSFGADDKSVVIDPALVADEDLDGASAELGLKRGERAVPEGECVMDAALVLRVAPEVVEAAGVFDVGEADVRPSDRGQGAGAVGVVIGEGLAKVEVHRPEHAFGVLITCAGAQARTDVMERRHLVERPAR